MANKSVEIPSDAIFINNTELTNDIVKESCKITLNRKIKNAYIAIGVVIGIAAVVARIFFNISTTITVGVLALGAFIVWQGTRLSMDNARRIIAQLGKGDDDLRNRTIYVTMYKIGVVTKGGRSQEFDLNEITEVKFSDKVISVVLKKPGVLIACDSSGFTKGTAEDFIEYVTPSFE